MDRKPLKVLDPFRNPSILSNIFRRLKVREKKQFRLVNQIWMNSSLEKWRESALVVIDVYETRRLRVYQNDSNSNNSSEEQENGLEQFLKLWESSRNTYKSSQIQELPFNFFKFKHLELNFGVKREETKNQTLIEKFWEIFAAKIKHLEMENCEIYCASFYDGMQWLLLKKCVNLKSLSISAVTVWDVKIQDASAAATASTRNKTLDSDSSSNTGACAKLEILKIKTIDKNWSDEIKADEFRQFLKILPNIKSLQLPMITIDKSAAQLLFVVAYPNSKDVQLQTQSVPVNLEELDLETEYIFPAALDYVKSAEPLLIKKLYLHDGGLKYFRDPPFYFHKFLSVCKYSLTNLRLKLMVPMEKVWITDLSGLSFPHLTHFKLEIREVWRKTVYARFDFGALRGMAKLKSFNCVSTVQSVGRNFPGLTEEELQYEGKDIWMGDDESGLEDFADLELENLTEFQFQMHRNFGESGLRKLGRMMKNLKNLKIVIHEDTLPIVEEVWPKLEFLTFLKGSTVKKIPNEEGSFSLPGFRGMTLNTNFKKIIYENLKSI